MTFCIGIIIFLDRGTGENFMFYDFNRYFLALLLPSATTAPSETNSDRYIFVRETCKPMASAIWVLLAFGVSVKY